MINTEMLLNPSWFNEDCLAASLSEPDSIYWAELQSCVKHIEAILFNMV